MTNISPESPEERRKRFSGPRQRISGHWQRVKSAGYAFEVVKRVAIGVYNDGFIHAGNLAYLALLTLFPFVIVAAAVARLVGQREGGMEAVIGLLQTMPPSVAEVLSKPIADVIEARSGNLLWFGALVGLWTTGSFIETIRDIIRRAYGVTYSRPFWEYRLGSAGMIVMDDSTDMVYQIWRLARFYAHESCAQCTQCREGTAWTTRILERILAGKGKQDDFQLLLDLSENMTGKTICVLSDSCAAPVVSGIRKFRSEFEAYIAGAREPALASV